MKKNRTKGKVFLIGAGPGDPGLITLKGIECVSRASVVIYDYLVSLVLLEHANSSAKLVYVGKKGGDHTFSQEEINNLIVDKAKDGQIVARLKGGDPFIFGRGGEEANFLVNAGVDFEVVPGVTSAIAASAYAGIPLTHRKYAADVTFVTGHEDPTKDMSSIDWLSLGSGRGTLVFFMGVKNLASIISKLKLNGRPSTTPIALIRWGTTTKQVTVTGTLDTIVDKCKKIGMKPPAVVVVGKVVSLRKTLKWFDRRPLFGKSIVVTRARAQASKLVKRLTELGSECLECPTIEVLPPSDWRFVDTVIDNISEYKWLVFTSVNGVDFFFQRFFEKGKDLRSLGDIKTAVIGPATARKLFEFGLRSDVLPENYCAESLLDAFTDCDVVGVKICLVRALEGREVLPVGLSKMGADLDEIHVYQTVKSDVNARIFVDRLKAGTIDMVTFTSSSTVENFKEIFSTEQLGSLLSKVSVACIGPITAATAQRLGFKVNIIARDYTIEGLCESIVHYFS